MGVCVCRCKCLAITDALGAGQMLPAGGQFRFALAQLQFDQFTIGDVMNGDQYACWFAAEPF